MFRHCLALTCALIVPAFLLADDKYTIKLKHAAAGDVAMHSREQTKTEAITIADKDGNVLQEKKQTTVETNKFKEEIIEKKAGQRSTKAKRTYSEATKKSDDATEKRSYDGQTVLIELKDDGYHFTVDGKELTGDDRGELPQNFDAKKPADEDMDKILLPTKAVSVNESWDIDGKKLTKLFGDEEKTAKTLDLDNVKANGKLVKAYKKDGRQFGLLNYKIEVPLKALEGEHPCREGATLVMTVEIDGCIDGSVEASSATFSMKIAGTADHMENGSKTGITIKFDISSTEKGATEPVKK